MLSVGHQFRVRAIRVMLSSVCAFSRSHRPETSMRASRSLISLRRSAASLRAADLVSNLWMVPEDIGVWDSVHVAQNPHIRAFGSRFLDEASLLEADSFAREA